MANRKIRTSEQTRQAVEQARQKIAAGQNKVAACKEVGLAYSTYYNHSQKPMIKVHTATRPYNKKVTTPTVGKVAVIITDIDGIGALLRGLNK